MDYYPRRRHLYQLGAAGSVSLSTSHHIHKHNLKLVEALVVAGAPVVKLRHPGLHVRNRGFYRGPGRLGSSPFVVATHVASSSARANKVPPSTSSVTSSPWASSTANSRGTATAAAMGLVSPRRISCSTRSASVPRIPTSSRILPPFVHPLPSPHKMFLRRGVFLAGPPQGS